MDHERPAAETGTPDPEQDRVHRAGADIQGSSTVENLLPEESRRAAYPVVMPRDRRKVAYKKQDIAALFSPAKKTDHAPLAVGAVYPLEACGVEVDLIQRALAAIESIQVPHPALQSRMRRVGEQKMPIETHIVVPFG